MTEAQQHPPCPSCGKELHLTPKRKGNCKACGEVFRLNKKGRLFGPLVTENQARAEDWFGALDLHLKTGVTGFRRVEAELAKQYGFEPAANDVIWGLYCRAKPTAYEKATPTMVRFLVEEGKDPRQLQREAHAHFLREMRKPSRGTHAGLISDIWVEIVGAACCQVCRNELDAKQVPISEALETMPIPNPTCTNTTEAGHQYCTCYYEWVLINDDFGVAGKIATPDGPVARRKPWREPKYQKGGVLDDIVSTTARPSHKQREQPKPDPRLRVTPIKKSFWEKFWGD